MFVTNRLVFLILVLFARATSAAPARTAPSFRAAIDKAQTLILEHDRKSAATVLTDALRLEKKDSVGYRELNRTLEAISEMFLLEKTQQTFELGRSVGLTDPVSAIGHFREALKAEPDHAGIVRALGRSLLGQGECDQSLAVSNEGLKVFPTSRDLALLKIQALACLRRSDELKEFLSLTESNLSQVQLFVELAKAQSLFFEEKPDLALGSAERAKSMDPGFPESYYWLAQILEKSGKDDQAYARVYIQLCKELTPGTRKKYEAEPRTCLESKKLEKVLESRPKAPPQKGAAPKQSA